MVIYDFSQFFTGRAWITTEIYDIMTSLDSERISCDVAMLQKTLEAIDRP